MVDYKRLGERIAQTRKSQKLSQEKLAELADITATNLSHCASVWTAFDLVSPRWR